MILASAIGVFLANSMPFRPAMTRVDVAVIARIYHKQGEYRELPKLYVCGIHGENRKAVPGERGSVVAMAWKSRNRLIWNESLGDPDFGPFERVEYDFSTRKNNRTRLKTLNVRSLEFQKGENLFTDSDTTVQSRGQNAVEFAYDENRQAFVLTARGKQSTFGSPDEWGHGMFFDKRTNRVWFYVFAHVSNMGTRRTLYRLEMSTGKVNKVFSHTDNFDFSPQRELYGAVENFRLPPNAKHRWPMFANAWVGNWKSGQKWPILAGNVYATEIALRPR